MMRLSDDNVDTIQKIQESREDSNDSYSINTYICHVKNH